MPRQSAAEFSKLRVSEATRLFEPMSYGDASKAIGDCYMAVTGLPDPQPKHATIMAKFALDCFTKMNQVLGELAECLGEGTESLSLRVGVHSGPVVAGPFDSIFPLSQNGANFFLGLGILQGEKSRFQLFGKLFWHIVFIAYSQFLPLPGDSVNFASVGCIVCVTESLLTNPSSKLQRMESTSESGRIQVSSETAALVRNAGKGHWLEPRQHKIGKDFKNAAWCSAANGVSCHDAVAKGIGSIQTYWLTPRIESVVGSGSTTFTYAKQGDNDSATDDEFEFSSLLLIEQGDSQVKKQDILLYERS